MSWREVTTAELFGARRPREQARRRRRAPEGGTALSLQERLLEMGRAVAVVALAGALALVGSLGVLTWLAAAAAASRLLAEERSGRRLALGDAARDGVRSLRGSWLPALGLLVGSVLVTINLGILWREPSPFALPMLLLNASVGALLLLLGAACVRELADTPGLPARALVRLALRRLVGFSRWHVAVLGATVLVAGATLLVPPAAVLLGPGLMLLAGRTRGAADHDRGDHA